MRTPVDLQSYMDEHGIRGQLIREIGATPTVPAAAAALGVEPEQIIKTLLFLVDVPGEPEAAPRPVVVISSGESRIDKRPLASHFAVGRKRIRLAPPDVVLELLGYPAGGVPPFGHRTELPVVLDQTVLDQADRHAGVIYGGGGDAQTMLRLTVPELMQAAQPVVLAVS